MALLPYALRPGRLLRRTALRRGLGGTSLFWSSIAGLLLGQGSYVRSQAIRRGLIGGSRSWQVLAGFMILKEAASSAGKQPENLGKAKVGTGSFLRLATEKPMTKKQQKAAGVTKASIKAQASADVAGAWARKAAVNPKRKIVRRAEKTATMAAADRRAANKRAATRAS
jgi:hypothetical protein